MFDEACPPVCPPKCELVFDRVVVSYLIRGGTRVMWQLLDTFTDPRPLNFQLQVGRTNNQDADDWLDVGLPVENAYFAFDPDQHVWGKTDWTHYRIKLTTTLGTYYSLPTGGMGILDRRHWRAAREMIRQKIKDWRLGPSGQEGYLLKRRWVGQNCPICLDYMTKEVTNPDCPDCYGTGKKCGYYFPMACVYASLSPKYRHTELDGDKGGQRGTINDVVVQAEMLGGYLLDELDIWVAKKTDDRYYIHEVQNTGELKGVPITSSVKLRPVPYSSIVYSINIPQQLEALGLGG